MCKYELRYVFDVGSNATKTMSCIVDKTCNVIVAVLETYKVDIPYQKYINSQELSEHAIKEGYNAFKKVLEFYNINPKLNGVKCAGIATAWARNASNSLDYLKAIYRDLGVKITIISQEEEGVLGMKSLLHSPRAARFDTSELIVLDIGGGSFQLSHILEGTIKVVNGPCGAINFNEQIKSMLGIGHRGCLTKDEVDFAIKNGIEYISSTLLSNTSSCTNILNKNAKQVLAMGQFINIGIKEIIKSSTIEITDVYEAVYKYCNLQEEHQNNVDKKQSEQINLMLLYSIMKSVEIEKIAIMPDVYSINAVALENGFWEEHSEDYSYMNIDTTLQYIPVWGEKNCFA